MKKIIKIVLCVILLFSICACKKDDNVKVNTDALKFKEEYESLNNKDDYIKVDIKENNYFTYINNNKLKNILNGGTGFIFIGDKTNNEARNIVNVLNYVNAANIYYIDINNVNDDVKQIINEKMGITLSKPIVIGVNTGNVIKYQEGTSYESLELTEEEKSELKLIYDDINAKVSDDSCDIEKPEDCD